MYTSLLGLLALEPTLVGHCQERLLGPTVSRKCTFIYYLLCT